MKVEIPRRLEATDFEEIAGYPVTGSSHFDGTKIRFENDNWLLLRFSGTEPVLRLFAEADTPEKAQALIDWAKNFVQT
jgi:phosphomannomutase